MPALRRILIASTLAVSALAWPVAAARKADNADEIERLRKSMDVLRDLTSNPDKAIPWRRLRDAEAIVVIPSLVKGGFVIGAKHGRGVMSVREAGERHFSPPGFVTMTGGTIGWQIGVESIDLVLLIMNRKGVNDLLSDKFTLGGSASVAAGPVGAGADAQSDVKMSAQVLAYSRASGLFAGATLEGGSLRGDRDANEDFYGVKAIDLRTIVLANAPKTHPPDIADQWHDLLTSLTNPKAPGR